MAGCCNPEGIKTKNVGSIMTTKVYKVAPETPISEVARIMRANGIGAVPVASRGRLVGMITDRDIVTRVMAVAPTSAAACAADGMTKRVYYTFDDRDADAALRNMRDLQIRRMPVVDREKRLVGIVSLGDLACSVRAEIAGDALEGISENLGG